MKPIICVISGSRSEYGLLRNVLLPLNESDLLDTQFIVTGSHLSTRHGNTIEEINKDGININTEIKILSDDDSPIGIASTMSRAIEKSSIALDNLKPDMILVLGDRYEIFAVSIAAMLLNIPISHIHGGESTEAAIDESIRHSLTKMSCFHFVAAEEYRKRVIQMGEHPDRVFFVGGLGIDSIVNNKMISKEQLEHDYKIDLSKKFLLVTFHSVTLDRENNIKSLDELFDAIDHFDDYNFIFTAPNADHDNSAITDRITSFSNKRDNIYFHQSFGQNAYLSLLNEASGVVGNSSSGLLEAPFFEIGTVNIGDRQKGRIRHESVVDVENSKQSITDGLNMILSEEFRKKIKNQVQSFGNGKSGSKIVRILETELSKPSHEFLKKEFFDLT